MSETMSARTSSKRKSPAHFNDSAVDLSIEEPRTPKRRKPAAPTTPTNRRTSASITRRGISSKIRRSGTQRQQRPQQSPSTPSTPEQPKWIHPDSSLSPQTVAWLKSAPSTPVSQFHPHLKTLEDANPGLFDKSGARPIGDEADEDAVGDLELGHIESDAADAEDVSSPSHGREQRAISQTLEEIMQTDVVNSIEVDTELPEVVDSTLRELVVVHHSIPPGSPLSPLSKDVIILRTSPLCLLNTLQAFAQKDLPYDISHPLMELLATVSSECSSPPGANSLSTVVNSPSLTPNTRYRSMSSHQHTLHARLLGRIRSRLLHNLHVATFTQLMSFLTLQKLRRLCQGQSEIPELADEILLRFLTYLEDGHTLRLLLVGGISVVEDETEADMYVDLGVGGRASIWHKTTPSDLESPGAEGPKDADHTGQADADTPSSDNQTESIPVPNSTHIAISALTSNNTLRQRVQLQNPGVHLPAQLLTTLRLRKLVIWSWLWLYRLMVLMCLK